MNLILYPGPIPVNIATFSLFLKEIENITVVKLWSLLENLKASPFHMIPLGINGPLESIQFTQLPQKRLSQLQQNLNKQPLLSLSLSGRISSLGKNTFLK